MSARILVIDDEANIRSMIKLALQHVGYSVDVAENGKVGLEMFGDGSNYDLILLDQKMPGLQGTEVLEQIVKRNSSVRVILVTAHGTMDLALEAIHAGATDFLRKPFTTETLRSSVQTALENPLDRDAAVPVSLVCREFTRTNINGYSIEFEGQAHDDGARERIYVFKVNSKGQPAQTVRILLPDYVTELVFAHADTESLPGGERFWQALCEEAVVAHLWENAKVPAGGQLRITDLGPSLKKWVDSVMTVALTEEHGR